LNAVTVPILRQGGILVAWVQSKLTDSGLLELRDTIVEELGQRCFHGVIIDLSAIALMDSFASQVFQDIAKIGRLRGARVVVAGIQPDVAMAMVQLDLKLKGATTVVDLDEALAVLGVTSARPDHNGS
jgi:rsbT antagonist protein RsbS